MIALTPEARAALRPGEALVFDWHRVAICCACAGEISLRCGPVARLERSGGAFKRLGSDPEAPVYVHRLALPHLAGRPVTISFTRTLGMRRFRSDLPTDFGLRASLGRL